MQLYPASVDTELLVVGGGNMGTALVRGLIASGRDASSVAIAETDPSRRSTLANSLRDVSVYAEPVSAQGAVLAVKPAQAESVCAAVAQVGVHRVLSVMAGVRLEQLEEWLASGTAVLRAMPNTPALVGAGASALAAGAAAGEVEVSWAEAILGAVGTVVRVPESALDAVTGLSGSGPAYLFYAAEALIESGKRLGLPEEVSRSLVLQTFSGSARMLVESGEEPAVLRARVTSPGGTTEAALRVLAAREVADALIEAVEAAARRSRELGG